MKTSWNLRMLMFSESTLKKESCCFSTVKCITRLLHPTKRLPVYSECMCNTQHYLPPASYQSMKQPSFPSCPSPQPSHFHRSSPEGRGSVNGCDWHLEESESSHWAVRFLVSNGSYIRYRNPSAVLSLAKSTSFSNWNRDASVYPAWPCLSGVALADRLRPSS